MVPVPISRDGARPSLRMLKGASPTCPSSQVLRPRCVRVRSRWRSGLTGRDLLSGAAIGLLAMLQYLSTWNGPQRVAEGRTHGRTWNLGSAAAVCTDRSFCCLVPKNQPNMPPRAAWVQDVALERPDMRQPPASRFTGGCSFPRVRYIVGRADFAQRRWPIRQLRPRSSRNDPPPRLLSRRRRPTRRHRLALYCSGCWVMCTTPAPVGVDHPTSQPTAQAREPVSQPPTGHDPDVPLPESWRIRKLVTTAGE